MNIRPFQLRFENVNPTPNRAMPKPASKYGFPSKNDGNGIGNLIGGVPGGTGTALMISVNQFYKS